jgi:hypothetical protein
VTGAVLGVAMAMTMPGCGGKSAALPDGAAPGDDATLDGAAPDGSPPDGSLPDGSPPDGAVPDGPPMHAITIRVYPDAVPSFTGITENAALVALQDGDGAWTSLSGTGGVYTAAITSTRYGVAVGCTAASLTVYYQSTDDASDLPVDGCPHPPVDAADITVSVVNAAARQTDVFVGVAKGTVTGVDSVHLAVAKRRGDVFAISRNPGNAADVTIYRGPTLDVTANTSLSVDLAQALPLEGHPLTLVGAVPPGASETFVDVQSRHYTPFSYGPRAVFTQVLAAGRPVTMTAEYKTLAGSIRQSDDLMYGQARTRGTTANGLNYDRVVGVQTASAVTLTMTLPDLLSADAPTVDNTAMPRATATLPMRPPTLGNALYDVDFTTNTGATKRTFAVVIRPGWAQGRPTVMVATPDLSALPGWTNDMALLPDVNVDWNIVVDDRNFAYGSPIRDGKRILQSFLFGTIERPPRIGAPAAAPDPGAPCRGGACDPRVARLAR